MNEEIEYAEMLEIPVSTVNVVRKPRKRKKNESAPLTTAPSETNIKDTVIASGIENIGIFIVLNSHGTGMVYNGNAVIILF